MKFFMALLALVALAEAGLSVCASGHARAQSAAGEAMASEGMEASHAGHQTAHRSDHPASHGVPHTGSHGHDGGHAGDHDCEEPVPPQPVSGDHCPDCATGRSCGDCALITALHVAGFESAKPLGDRLDALPYSDVALARTIHDDPPPPKRLTPI